MLILGLNWIIIKIIKWIGRIKHHKENYFSKLNRDKYN